MNNEVRHVLETEANESSKKNSFINQVRNQEQSKVLPTMKQKLNLTEDGKEYNEQRIAIEKTGKQKIYISVNLFYFTSGWWLWILDNFWRKFSQSHTKAVLLSTHKDCLDKLLTFIFLQIPS